MMEMSLLINLRLGGREDSYRTASLQLSVGDFSAGLPLFTGRRIKKDQEDEINLPTNTIGRYAKLFKNGFVNEKGILYRLRALIFGYKGFRIGTNSEHVQEGIKDEYYLLKQSHDTLV